MGSAFTLPAVNELYNCSSTLNGCSDRGVCLDSGWCECTRLYDALTACEQNNHQGLPLAPQYLVVVLVYVTLLPLLVGFAAALIREISTSKGCRALAGRLAAWAKLAAIVFILTRLAMFSFYAVDVYTLDTTYGFVTLSFNATGLSLWTVNLVSNAMLFVSLIERAKTLGTIPRFFKIARLIMLVSLLGVVPSLVCSLLAGAEIGLPLTRIVSMAFVVIALAPTVILAIACLIRLRHFLSTLQQDNRQSKAIAKVIIQTRFMYAALIIVGVTLGWIFVGSSILGPVPASALLRLYISWATELALLLVFFFFTNSHTIIPKKMRLLGSIFSSSNGHTSQNNSGSNSNDTSSTPQNSKDPRSDSKEMSL